MSDSTPHTKQRGSALVIIVTVAAVLVVIAAIAYVLLSKKDSKPSLGNVFHKTVTATTADEVKTLLTDARAGKYDAKCTYLLKSHESSLYIKGDKKMRIDTVIDDKPGHFLGLDDSMYIWADGNPKGSILPLKNNKDSEYSPDSFANRVEEYHVKCESVASLSDSLFVPPSDVTFADFKAQGGSASSPAQ